MRKNQMRKKVIALTMVGILAMNIVPFHASASSELQNSIRESDDLKQPTDNNVREELLNESNNQKSDPAFPEKLDEKKEEAKVQSDKEIRLQEEENANEDNPSLTPQEPEEPEEPPVVKETEIETRISFAKGKEKPVEIKEAFNEGEQPSTVYYLKQDGKISIQINDQNFEGAEANIGVRMNGGETTWTTEPLTKEDSAFEYTYKEAGKYEIYVWVKEANGVLVGKDPETGAIAEKSTTRFVIDKTAPVLGITGIKKDSKVNQAVTLQFSLEEVNALWDSYQVTIVQSYGSSEIKETKTLKKEDWVQNQKGVQQSLSFSKEGQYKIVFEGKDKANNVAVKQETAFMIDKTAPEIVSVSYYNDAGYISEKYESIYSDDVIVVEVVLKDALSGINDDKVFVTIGADTNMTNAKTFSARALPGNTYSVFVPKDLGLENFNDKIVVWAYDKAGNKNYKSTAKLVVTSSKPNISLDYDQNAEEWINEDFKVRVKVDDTIAGLQDIVYKVNGKKVKKVHFDELTSTYSYDLVAKDSADSASGYRITIEATNNCGNKRIMNKTVFIDKVKPEVTLSGVNNGAYYNSNQTIHVEVSEEPSKGSTTTFYAERELDGKKYPVKLKKFVTKEKKASCDRQLEEEGTYSIYAITEDAAGNKKKSNVLQFTIDKTAPKLQITGVTNGQLSAKEVGVTFQCEESFYEGNQVQVEVQRSMNGKTSAEKVGNFTNKGKVSSMQQSFTADGVYRVRVTAKDKAGNVAEAKEVTFTIDQSKPVIVITGTDNYQMWDNALDVLYTIEENFYSDMKVTIEGTRTDIDGNETKLEMPVFPNTAAVSSLTQQFTEEGVYVITINAEDKVGNKDFKEIHFTVDRTAPSIEGVAQFDGGYYQEFNIADSMYGMFKDLTVLSYRILLNGIEYDGKSTIKKEGKYTLDIEATDELNHKKNEVIEFMIDRTEPKVIFNGVKDGETVKEKGMVTFALTESDDEITAVRMNGVEYDASIRTLAFEKYGDYLIEVDSIDRAGNEGHKTLTFTYENPKRGSIIFAGAGFCILVIGAWIVILSLKKRKEVK